MLGIFQLVKNGLDKLPDDNTILDEAQVENITGAQEYAGKSWAQIKAELSQGNPFVQLINTLLPFLEPLTNTIGAIVSASFLSISQYKNPIAAVKEDISMILKGGVSLLTLSAILALAWKVATIWATLAFVRKKLK